MPLPSFFIPGAQKCGTTTIAKCLQSHPEIHIPYTVLGSHEMHFFNTHWAKGIRWYEDFFRHGKVNGDKSPDYLLNPVFIARMARTCPDAKIIFCVRNPVDRLISQVNMRRSIGKSGLTYQNIINNPEYFDRGLYGRHYNMLTNYYTKDKIFIAVNDKPLRNNPLKIANESGRVVEDTNDNVRKMMEKIFDFLGLDTPNINYKYHFVASVQHPLQSIIDRKQEILRAYSADIRWFFDQIGYEIEGWL